MSGEPELEAMATVWGALQSLTPDEQARVLRWVIDKLKVSDATVTYSQVVQVAHERNSQDENASSIQLSVAATTWIRQNDLTTTDLESVFHLEGAETALIAAHLPGIGMREKVLNCYILTGIRELLRSGDAIFSDRNARDVCAEFGCLDTTNHTKYINEKGNEFTGSKEKGWTLTAPGKKRGASLVKEITSGTKQS